MGLGGEHVFCMCSVSRSSDNVYESVVDVLCHSMSVSADEYVGVLVDNHVVEFLSVLCHKVLDVHFIFSFFFCVGFLSGFCDEEFRECAIFFKGL